MNLKKICWVVRAVFYSTRAKIGFPSYMGRPILISDISKLCFSKKVRIYPGLRCELEGENSYLKIGENTSIGQNFHVVAYNNPLIIGKNVTISGNVFITNCDHSYDKLDTHILEQPIIEKKTIIGDNCFIGYGAVIQAGTILGKQCIVGSNAVVRGEYPDYTVIAGNPARIIRQYNQQTNTWEKV